MIHVKSCSAHHNTLNFVYEVEHYFNQCIYTREHVHTPQNQHAIESHSVGIHSAPKIYLANQLTDLRNKCVRFDTRDWESVFSIQTATIYITTGDSSRSLPLSSFSLLLFSNRFFVSLVLWFYLNVTCVCMYIRNIVRIQIVRLGKSL